MVTVWSFSLHSPLAEQTEPRCGMSPANVMDLYSSSRTDGADHTLAALRLGEVDGETATDRGTRQDTF
jgi:hypothetical protein